MTINFEDEGWSLDLDDGFVGHVGGIWWRQQPDLCEVAFTATKIHANRNGVVHGGMLMTFVDRAFGLTARLTTGATTSATISLTHQFLAPTPIGAQAYMQARVSRATGRMAFLEGTVMVDGIPAVTAQGVWRVFHAKS